MVQPIQTIGSVHEMLFSKPLSQEPASDLSGRVQTVVSCVLSSPQVLPSPNVAEREVKTTSEEGTHIVFAFDRATSLLQCKEKSDHGMITRFLNQQNEVILEVEHVSLSESLIRTYSTKQLCKVLNYLFLSEKKRLSDLLHIQPEEVSQVDTPVCIFQGFWGKITKEETFINAIGTRDLESCTSLVVCGIDQSGKSSIWLSHLFYEQNPSEFIDQILPDIQRCTRIICFEGKKTPVKSRKTIEEALQKQVLSSVEKEVFVSSAFYVKIEDECKFQLILDAPLPTEKSDEEYEEDFKDLNTLISANFSLVPDEPLFESVKPLCKFFNNRFTDARFKIKKNLPIIRRLAALSSVLEEGVKRAYYDREAYENGIERYMDPVSGSVYYRRVASARKLGPFSSPFDPSNDFEEEMRMFNLLKRAQLRLSPEIDLLTDIVQ